MFSHAKWTERERERGGERERAREREREVRVVVITQGRQDVLLIIFTYVDSKLHINVAAKSYERMLGNRVISLTQITRL